MLRHVVLLVYLLFSAATQAADWATVIANVKMHSEADRASFNRQGALVTIWEREVYIQEEQAQPGDFFFKSSKSLIRYNCQARTADMLVKVFYDADGAEIKTVTAGYYGRQNFVIPDSEGERKFEYACSYKKPPEKRTVVAKKKPKPTTEKEAASPAKNGKSLAETKVKSTPLPPPRSLPIHKPSGVLVKPVAAESGKGKTVK